MYNQENTTSKSKGSIEEDVRGKRNVKEGDMNKDEGNHTYAFIHKTCQWKYSPLMTSHGIHFVH